LYRLAQQGLGLGHGIEQYLSLAREHQDPWILLRAAQQRGGNVAYLLCIALAY
jgi:hypothetical protein